MFLRYQKFEENEDKISLYCIPEIFSYISLHIVPIKIEKEFSLQLIWLQQITTL